MKKCPYFKRRTTNMYGWGIRCYKYGDGKLTLSVSGKTDLCSRDDYIRKYCNGKYEECSHYKIIGS